MGPIEILAFCGQEFSAGLQMRNMMVGDRRGSVEAMADMALTACCRRKALLAYFGERRGRCQAQEEELCDFCRDPKAVVIPRSLTHHNNAPGLECGASSLELTGAA